MLKVPFTRAKQVYAAQAPAGTSRNWPALAGTGDLALFQVLQGPIFSIFERPKKASKNQGLFDPPKNHQNGTINRPLGAQGTIFHQKVSAAPRRGGERVRLQGIKLANASF